MPRPTLTQHARDRLSQRFITEQQVYEALAHEQRRTPGQPGSIWVHGRVAGGRILKVCISTGRHPAVITAAWPDE